MDSLDFPLQFTLKKNQVKSRKPMDFKELSHFRSTKYCFIHEKKSGAISDSRSFYGPRSRHKRVGLLETIKTMCQSIVQPSGIERDTQFV